MIRPADSVAAGLPPDASGADGLSVLRVAEAVEQALTTPARTAVAPPAA